MKLTPNQKELLACIKDKEIRKEVKKEFKKKITFYHTRWKLLDEYDFKNDDFISKNPGVSGYFGKHPMNGVLFKNEFESTFGEGFPWYEMESKKFDEKFDELVNEFNIKEKAIEILSEKKPNEFCVEITSENRSVLQKIWNEFHQASGFLGNSYLCSNSDFTHCYSSNNRRRMNVYDSNSQYYTLPIVSTKDFLKLIGREDFIERKFSDTPIGGHTFRGKLNENQIERVILWMNTWEQLKDTAIPIRFKEDFTNKKFEFKGFDSKNYRFSPKGEIGDKLKVEKILPKEDVDTFKKEIQSMISADISHLTFTTELNNGNFVFYKDNHKPFEYSGKISEMTFSDKLAIVEKIESYAEELDVNLKPKGKFIIPK